jgi:PhnB protein
VKLTTYVNFAGNCDDAFRYYATHLGAVPGLMVRHGDGPSAQQLPPGWETAILHGRITIGDIELMAADIPGAEPMRSAYLTLRVDEDATAKRFYTALAKDGRVLMPLAETFFASQFAQVQDQFGINWMILRERPRPAA